MVVALWVDDCLVRGTSRATTEFYAKLGKKFDIKDPTYLTQESPLTFVGFEITTALTTRPGRKRQIVGINQDVAMNRFLEDHGVGLSDGSDFGAPGFLRLNLGCSRTLLEQALDRIDRACASLV